MNKLSRGELIKLSALCKARYYDARSIMASDDVTGLEKELAKIEAEYMSSLFCKLEDIATGNGKRIEII